MCDSSRPGPRTARPPGHLCSTMPGLRPATRLAPCLARCGPLVLALAACHGGTAHQGGGADETAGSEGSGTSASTTTSTTAGSGADTSEGTSSTGIDPDAAQILLHFGDEVPVPVRERVIDHVEAVAARPVVVLDADDIIGDPPADSWVLSFGDTPSTRELIAASELDGAPSETVIVRSGQVAGLDAIVTDARPLDPDPHGHAHLGLGYGAYAILEELGFAFLHPLAPMRPEALPDTLPQIDSATSPRWPIRGLQLHTMHPLELTEMLQGWGPGGPDDLEGWQAMLPEWDAFLEWMLANRQNRVHWVLLRSESWGEFADGQEHIDRLHTLVSRAHDFGVWAGLDTPIRQHQQNTWRLIREDGELEDELAQLRDNVDYLMQAELDYLATESGTTEFTPTDDTRMVAWMDELARHLDEAHGRSALIKIHTSSGQTVANYDDPDTGEPLNFNFLPHYADPRMGIMPHTIQHYGLDDPAPTYGNTDFAFMLEFMAEEAGSRTVVWHPETAYWVSFDIDVPLLLPVYAERRLHDLRMIAAAEDAGMTGRGELAGSPIDGQLTFSSGWEWGYWLQEVTTARASWDPHVELDDDEALRVALAPIVRPFGAVGPQVSDLLVELAQAQHELMIEGRVGGTPPADILRRSGQAYLQGFEPFDDLTDLAQDVPGLTLTMTQPEKLGLVEMRNPLHVPPPYSSQLEPLLDEMEGRFTVIADGLEALAPEIPAPAQPLFADLQVGARVTALRAQQLHALYDYTDGLYDQSDAVLEMRLQRARDALDEAAVLVLAHESNYRVDPDRIAGWRPNPTAYSFTYLWTARSLYYWWRDEAKAVLAPVSPCYLNIIDPVLVGFGEGSLTDSAGALAAIFDAVPGLGGIAECLTVPAGGPPLPPPGVRD